ncbi:MAG TPA: class I mannose-6-phosphate isomerase [Bryobacteraceae bacterium]|nr:class I mannose-6-phosphate isomerase [Bryobacteraceae bacterium]
MTIEHARAHALPKPWGVAEQCPWNGTSHNGPAIGEIWYERSTPDARAPRLLLKLLFTSEPLSIQVHPDDVYARSMGFANGKTEAWYVLSAQTDAKVALGLTRRFTSRQLRQAVDDGSISDLVVWQPVHAGDSIFVPAGTIHAIGAGLVIAEIQQRGDATFRLFDHGRGRELHINDAIAVANARPADFGGPPTRLSAERALLTSNSHFTFERIDLASNSIWRLEAERETWLLVISGSGRAGPFGMDVGDAIFLQSDRINIHSGKTGLVALLACTGGDVPKLLRCADADTVQ